MELNDFNKLKEELTTASKLVSINNVEEIKTAIDIKEVEEKTEEEIEKQIEKLREEKQSIIEKYHIPKEYILSVAKGFNKAFIFLGEAGIGKTFLTRQVLAKINIPFVESRGVNSPLALYEFLYEHRDNKTIIFDDVNGLVNNPNAYSILLSVLWEGIANWNSTSEKLKIPKKFIFNSRIIIIANKLEGENSDVVKSRCLTYELRMSNKDLIEMMYEIAKKKHEFLSIKEREEIVKFIEENHKERFDLRTQQKIEQLYLYDKKNWKSLGLPLLQRNDDYTILLECLESNKSVKKAEKEFCDKTGKSRITFYRMKKEITKPSIKDTNMLTNN